VLRCLVTKYELKKSFGRPGRRWDDIIETDLDEIVWGDLERIHLV
jgi:hypothetical protein